MAHYAFLDENNIVTEVIVGKNEGEEGIDWEAHYGAFRGQVCKRTSYNTWHNQHSSGGVPFRKNMAMTGYLYDERLDAFIPPQPDPRWVLDEDIGDWVPPVPKPNDGKEYAWDYGIEAWVDVATIPTEG